MRIIHSFMGLAVLVIFGMLIGGCKADSTQDDSAFQNSNTNEAVGVSTNDTVSVSTNNTASN